MSRSNAFPALVDYQQNIYVSGVNFTVFLKKLVPVGFEHNELGDEYGGGIWVEGYTVVDYDGISGYLPTEVCQILNALGFDTSDCEEPDDES